MADTHTAGAAGAAAGAETKAATRLGALKTNAAYLALGDKAATKPGSVATRSVLTTFRWV